MAKGFKHGSGGSNPLNFKVICNPQPETAKENTIWVDTDRINNYYFAVTQPENMVDYDVWISTATSSAVAFSATTGNPIMVYPVAAKQYIGGVLANTPAKSWQGGEWVEWVPEGALFWDGNQCADLTGGWEKNAGTKFYGIANNGTVTFDGVIHLQSTSTSQSAVATTKEAIDLSGHDTMTIMVDDWSSSNSLEGMVSINRTSPIDIATDNTPLRKGLKVGLNTVDVSGINEKMYISVGVYHVTKMDVSRIRLG